MFQVQLRNYKLLGSSESKFKVKYNQCSNDRGYLVMEIDGCQIGSFEDEIYLEPFFRCLKLLIENNGKYNSWPFSFSKLDLKENIDIDDLLQVDDGMLPLPESFDDFLFRAIPLDNGVYCFWELGESPFFNYNENVKGKKKSYISLANIELILSQWNKLSSYGFI